MYVPIDRPVHIILSLYNTTFMFSKDFLSFRKEDDREEAIKKMVQVPRGGPTTFKGHFMTDGNPFTV